MRTIKKTVAGVSLEGVEVEGSARVEGSFGPEEKLLSLRP